MTQTRKTMQRTRRRATLLAAIILAQFLCALFFLGDAADDLFSGTTIDGAMFTLELIATAALFAGVIYLALELRQLLAEMERMEHSIRAASGEMAEVIDAFFTEWRLTPSERDVALMVLKGIDNDTIASLRGTAPGTVRAQCTSVYAKAGVDGRAQLFSVFMEELLAGEG